MQRICKLKQNWKDITVKFLIYSDNFEFSELFFSLALN